MRREDTTQKVSECVLQLPPPPPPSSFCVRSRNPGILGSIFLLFPLQDLPMPLCRLFLADMMGLRCTAAPPSPCPQLGRLRSAWFPSPGGYYPHGSIWLLAGSVGSRAGRVWSSLLALSCGNLSVGSSGSLVLLHAFSSQQTSEFGVGQ